MLKKVFFQVPYYGAMALIRPENGAYIAALSELTGKYAVNRMRFKLSQSHQGQRLLRNRPIVNTEKVNLSSLLLQEKSTFGRKYADYMTQYHFNPDERPPVQFIHDDDDNNKENDDELAYVILRYRQVHDFWHVLCDLPPTLLGEVALKCFEWRVTGLPSCGLSTLIGPLRLSAAERSLLVTTYIPWAIRSATECEDLMTYAYEENLQRNVEDVRVELNLEPAPQLANKRL